MITLKKFPMLPVICTLAGAAISPAMAVQLNPQPLPPRIHPHLGHPPGNPGTPFYGRKAGGDKGYVVSERTFRPG